MRPLQIITRISQAFHQLAAGGSEQPTSRGALFEETAADFEQLRLWWQTESRLVNSAYLALDIDHTLRVDASGAPRIVTLPPAAAVAGMVLTVKKIDATANAVTVDANGAELIDGVLTFVMTTQYASITIQSNGVGWDVLQSGTASTTTSTITSTITALLAAFISAGAEVLNEITCRLQVYAADGVTPVATNQVDLFVRVTDTNSSFDPSPTAYLLLGGVGQILSGANTASAVFRTDVNGQIDIKVHENIGIVGQNTNRYLWLHIDGNSRKVVIARDDVFNIIFH